MRRSLICTVAAESAALATAEQVKTIFPDLEMADAALDAHIEAASEMLANLLNFPRAAGEVQPILLQTYEETILAGDRFDYIQLSRRPLVSIETLVSDGVGLSADALLINWESGQIFMRDRTPFGCDLAVTYQAGYRPQSDSNPDVPQALMRAVAFLVHGERLAADDEDVLPAAKAERLGDYSITYDTPSMGGSGELPMVIKTAVDKYKWRVA